MREDSYSNLSDGELVEGLQRGEEGAFDEVFHRYRRLVFAYLRGKTGDRHLAEDIVEETFIALVRNAARIDAARGVRGWLFRTARNRAVDALRQRQFETPVEDVYPAELPGKAVSPAERVVAGESAQLVRKALSDLPERERDLMILRFYGGLTFRETAHVLKRPLGTVLWQARKILGKLKAEMGRGKS
ncbi:MAG: RNA polymerase sigma factor [Kiritimatiellia bacterium]